ncbi:hypothetical protein METBIDRAFT_80143 [Metschnikowia bicuspidata var. bicuspidata NRRL YB-4993]|uniref:diphosphoinositol-polyphosphate diphosphatase n=1 Tax=Metschnikowia bicuspidata var. bicuspidata NRRL YB-4993 TaxID=869754 RepID=A0A1A0H206_9ASCO|nr:hypothetical protein METBIDRAFT_80143 [Metschnikowia bicuspidata var. bicuspidata NRRL YB-4993]OBA18064.1 hypothetical protein METBIDRAFT_80143 [Metschnikowia bicuspidata var. bicuspidata NRRL YB-4993]
MADFSEDPFQMDEDIQTPPERSLSLPGHTGRAGARADDAGHVPPFPAGGITQLRSRLTRIKIEDGPGTTTEEEGLTYEEDADDKFDADAGDKHAQMYASNEVAAGSGTLTPPENFAPVINRVYRLSFPQTHNFGFLKKLQLKAVLCLIPEEYPQAQQDFFEKEGIRLFQLGMLGNKEPFVKISSELITQAVQIVINPENQPILIHCNRGKHRTGCLVGVLRRLQGWSLTIIFDEYRMFAAPKERPMDQQFIELYDEAEIVDYAESNGFLPMAWL